MEQLQASRDIVNFSSLINSGQESNPNSYTDRTPIQDDEQYALYEEQDKLIEQGIRLICGRIN